MLTKLLNFVNIIVVSFPRSPGGQELKLLRFRELHPQPHLSGGKMLPVVSAGWRGRRAGHFILFLF